MCTRSEMYAEAELYKKHATTRKDTEAGCAQETNMNAEAELYKTHATTRKDTEAECALAGAGPSARSGAPPSLNRWCLGLCGGEGLTRQPRPRHLASAKQPL